MKLTIGHLYPDLLNLYGDCGNIQCLQKRLQWRDIDTEVRFFLSGDDIDFSELDIILLGGGSDREQELACRELRKMRQELSDYVENGGTLLAICGGYQLLGHYYQTKGERIAGLGILDIYTRWQPRRLTGNIVLKSPLVSNPVVGFENHGGRTYIGNYSSLGKVIQGFGNNEISGQEGIVYKNLIGTYLHGPLLPKNPELCDLILERALRKKYQGAFRLPLLPDELEYRANQYIANLSKSRRLRLASAPLTWRFPQKTVQSFRDRNELRWSGRYD